MQQTLHRSRTLSLAAATATVAAAAAAALALVAAPGRAHADLTTEQQAIQTELLAYQSAVVSGKESGNRVAYYFDKKPADCLAAVERGQKAGIAPTQVMSGNPDSYLFKRAADKCEEYRQWQLLTKAAVAVAEANNTYNITKHMSPGEVSGEVAKKWGEKGTICITEVDKLIEQGAPADVAVPIEGEKLTLTDAKAKICQPLVDWGGKFAVETDKAREAAAAAVREKYSKHGITGDRLKLLVEEDGTTFYGKGCDSGIDDIKQLKKAKLLFYWTELANGAGWGVRRYQFSGDKLVKESYREFSRQEAAYAWCK